MLWIALIIASGIALYELSWIGRSSLWWVLVGLAVAIALIAVHLLLKEREK
jgi:hypothetical protein